MSGAVGSASIPFAERWSVPWQEKKSQSSLLAAAAWRGGRAKLAADGYQVAVMSSSGKGEALGQELGGVGFTGSNRSPDDLKAFDDLTIRRFDRIDALVNGAGHGPRAPLSRSLTPNGMTGSTSTS
jgi:hypothetical protein